MLLRHLSQMVHSVHEGETRLVVRVKEAIVVLVERGSLEAAAILSEAQVVL